MKKFKIIIKLIFDFIMGIIMIPFILVMLSVILFSMFLHFPYWKITKIRKR
jgi:hypothetical protein